MAIIADHSSGLFTLHTKSSTYQMKVESHGFLVHTYYGARAAGQDFSYLVQQQDRGFAANPPDAEGDRTLSPDTLPLEYSTFGLGDFRESCLDVCHGDGSIAADLRVRGYRILKGKPGLLGLPASYGKPDDVSTLEIELADTAGGVQVTLQYGVFEAYDVITRSARIKNISNTPIALHRALSCCIDLHPPVPRDILTFYGRHMGEHNVERTPLRHGKIRVDSMRGSSSPHQSPFVIICDSSATEMTGECMAFSFVYSGNFLAQAEVDQISQVRLVMGIHPQNFCWHLDMGEFFQTPEVLCCYSEQGFDVLSNSLNRFQLKHLMRGPWRERRCPILLNNWEATYFDFDEETLLALAHEAKELGIEMLVLDDGWFGCRNDDTSSLGDWFDNRKKLPNGINGLAKRLHSMGLLFGLWFEPEMVSPDSALMRAHPEWCLRMPGRAPMTSRSQCVLDMSRPDVVEYLFNAIANILAQAQIDYVKWDMNRSITDAWSAFLSAERQGEIWHRYILGVYALLERLLACFPELLLESCASGGGRYDAGMLYYSPQIWCSDNTDAVDRLFIQYGTSFIFPAKSMGSHVSASPNHQTGRSTPFSTRGAVAMAGTFGYELDPSRSSETQKNEIRAQIEQFKRQWKVNQLGSYHRLTDPNKNHWFTAWMTVSQDGSQAIVNCVVTNPCANAPVLCIRLRGLDADASYRDDAGNVYTGRALMCGGLVLTPMRGDYPAIQVVLTQIFPTMSSNH